MQRKHELRMKGIHVEFEKQRRKQMQKFEESKYAHFQSIQMHEDVNAIQFPDFVNTHMQPMVPLPCPSSTAPSSTTAQYSPSRRSSHML